MVTPAPYRVQTTPRNVAVSPAMLRPMLFADTSLIARIERAEGALLTEGVQAGVARRGMPEAFSEPICGGVAGFAEAGSPLNKVVGLGVTGSIDESALDDIEHKYAARNCPVQIELSTNADPSAGALLTKRGYELVGFENVLGYDLQDLPTIDMPDGVSIAPSDAADFDRWLRTIVDGFISPDAQGVPSHESFSTSVLEQSIGDMAAARGMSRLLATRHGEAAGAASVRIADGVAQLCGAATLPAHRRRGIQTALLLTRLHQARDSGCDLAVVTTQPGSKSMQNVMRQGFSLLYSRAVLVKTHSSK